MNQTIVISPADVVTQTVTENVNTTQVEGIGFDFMMILRIAWYIFCFFKILSIALYSRPKMSVR